MIFFIKIVFFSFFIVVTIRDEFYTCCSFYRFHDYFYLLSVYYSISFNLHSLVPCFPPFTHLHSTFSSMFKRVFEAKALEHPTFFAISDVFCHSFDSTFKKSELKNCFLNICPQFLLSSFIGSQCSQS